MIKFPAFVVAKMLGKAFFIENSKEITFHDVLCASQKVGTVLADVEGTAPIAVISGRKVETITAYEQCREYIAIVFLYNYK